MDVVARVKGILLTPKTEWLVIEREREDPKYLFSNYVAILGAVPPAAFLIGGLASRSGGVTLFLAIILYLLAFVFSYAVALMMNALAPMFGGEKNFANALKLSVYSYTPGWLAGVFGLIPPLSFLTVLGFYSLYLFWAGTSPLMKVPQGRAIGYTAAAVVCVMVLIVLLVVILVAVLRLL